MLIDAMRGVRRQPSRRPALEPVLAQFADHGWGSLVAALRALLDGARDEAALCGPLRREDGLIVSTILRCLAGPAAEQALPSGPE